jgi:type II restriction enzyme
MNLSMTGALAAAYHSGAQRARVVTEAWGEKNLYCPNCSSPKLTWLEPGHPASDYSCPKCRFWFQLKSQKSLKTFEQEVTEETEMFSCP